MPVIPEALPPVLDGVGDDGGVVELARDEDELLADLNFSEKIKVNNFIKENKWLTDLPAAHLLVEARGVAVGERVPRVLRVQLGVLQDLPLRRRQTLQGS